MGNTKREMSEVEKIKAFEKIRDARIKATRKQNNLLRECRDYVKKNLPNVYDSIRAKIDNEGNDAEHSETDGSENRMDEVGSRT